MSTYIALLVSRWCSICFDATTHLCFRVVGARERPINEVLELFRSLWRLDRCLGSLIHADCVLKGSTVRACNLYTEPTAVTHGTTCSHLDAAACLVAYLDRMTDEASCSQTQHTFLTILSSDVVKLQYSIFPSASALKRSLYQAHCVTPKYTSGQLARKTCPYRHCA